VTRHARRARGIAERIGDRYNRSGDLSAGHVVRLTLTMSEAVTVNAAGGTPTLTLGPAEPGRRPASCDPSDGTMEAQLN
jgi:hypothetical protein